MVKQILKFSGTSTTNQLRISNFIKAEEYTGIKVFCKTSLVVIVKIEGSINGIDVDFAENYKFQNEESTSINLKVEHEYYRVSIEIPALTNVRFSSVFCELVKENKSITFDGTYDVKGFDKLKLTLFNRTRMLFPVNGTLNYQAYSSCGEVLNNHTTLTITNKNTVARPLLDREQFGGYFLKTNTKERNINNPYNNTPYNEPVVGLVSSFRGSTSTSVSILPLTVEVLEESILRENEFDDILNLIEYGKITSYTNNNNFEDNVFLGFVKNGNFTQMENALNDIRTFSMFAYIKLNDGFNSILQTNYEGFPDGGFMLFSNGSNEITFGDSQSGIKTTINVDLTIPIRVVVVASIFEVSISTLYEIYINGTLRGSYTNTTSTPNNVVALKVRPLHNFNGTLINFTMFPEVLTSQDITALEAFNVETHLFLDDIQSQTIDVRGIDQVLIKTEMSNELNEITDEFTKIHIEGLLF